MVKRCFFQWPGQLSEAAFPLKTLENRLPPILRSCLSLSSSKTVTFLGGCTNLLCSQKQIRGKCFLALKDIRGAFFNASGLNAAKWEIVKTICRSSLITHSRLAVPILGKIYSNICDGKLRLGHEICLLRRLERDNGAQEGKFNNTFCL